MNHRIRNFLVLFLAAFMLIIGTTGTFAANRVVPGNTTQMSLAESADANTVSTLKVLRGHAAESGKIRIIVGLRTTFVPESRLTAEVAQQQRDEIARVQRVVLGKMPSLKQKPETIKRFASSPFMALEVNAAELETLASLAEIASIEEDRLAAPTVGIEVVVPESK